MTWQIIALIGILLIVSALVGGGVKLVGVGEMQAFQGVGRAVGVAVAGVAVLGIAFATWRGAPISQRTEQTGLAGALNPIMHEINSLFTQWEVGMGPTDLTLDPTSGRLGKPIHATGSGFLPGEKVDLLSGQTVLATVIADKNGDIDTNITVKDGKWCFDSQCEITVQGKQSLNWTTATYDLP